MVEDSRAATEDNLPSYFVYHNLSIARQCLHSILKVLPGDIRDGECKTGLSCDSPEESSDNLYSSQPVELLEQILELINQLDNAVGVSAPAVFADYYVSCSRRGDLDTQFRHLLVDLMVLTLQCWEQTTGKDKIELAESSKLWKVTNDNSQLRVRTLDRYLSIKKLPKVPRWQTVLDTAYFVLHQSPGDSQVVRQLELAVSNTVAALRSRALL